MASGGRPQRGAQKVSAILNGSDDSANSVRFYDFDRFRLDAKRRLLTRDGEPIGIKPKALEVLLLLVRHRDRPGVLAHVFDALRRGNLNVQETENIIFEGAEAAVARINLDAAPPKALLDEVRSGNSDIISLQLVRI